jgi:antitoxin MazE
MRVTVKKWGNSASVRIPVSIMAAAKLRLEQPVDVREDKGRIIIEPVRHPKYDLNDLVAQITEDNRHGEADFGKPVGTEIF